MQLDIIYHDIDSTPTVDTAVRAWADRLAKIYDRIVACHVTVSKPHRHKRHTSEAFAVNVRLDVPGAELASTNHSHTNVQVAIGDAFRAARRRLQDYAEVQRGDVKRHPLRGVVAAFARAR